VHRHGPSDRVECDTTQISCRAGGVSVVVDADHSRSSASNRAQLGNQEN